jgi:hypothetical protein
VAAGGRADAADCRAGGLKIVQLMSKVDLSRPQSGLGLSRKRPTASNSKPQTFCECPERKTGPSPCAQQSPIFETRVSVQQSVRTHPEHAEHALDCSHHPSDCSFLPCARRSTLVGSPGGTCRDKFQGFSSFGLWAEFAKEGPCVLPAQWAAHAAVLPLRAPTVHLKARYCGFGVWD